MNNPTTCPMEADCRSWLLKTHVRPLKRKAIIAITASVIAITTSLLSPREGRLVYSVLHPRIVRSNITATISMEDFIFINVSIVLLCMLIFYALIINTKSYRFYRDYKSSTIIKEQAKIEGVLATPAGLTVYVLDSKAIPSIVTENEHSLAVGQAINIYYLKYAKSLLKYEV